VRVPGGKALRVLGGHAERRAVGAPEHDRHVDGARAHVEGLGGRVDDVVDGLHGEVEGHELADGLEAGHGGAHGDASDAHLSESQNELFYLRSVNAGGCSTKNKLATQGRCNKMKAKKHKK